MYSSIDSRYYDPKKATEWYLKAAEQGHFYALFALADIYSIPNVMKSVDINLIKALAYYYVYYLALKDSSEGERSFERAKSIAKKLSSLEVEQAMLLAKQLAKVIESNDSEAFK